MLQSGSLQLQPHTFLMPPFDGNCSVAREPV
jgi:hypothetical protein